MVLNILLEENLRNFSVMFVDKDCCLVGAAGKSFCKSSCEPLRTVYRIFRGFMSTGKASYLICALNLVQS